MQCLRCGRQNKATNEYCEGCGATLGIECGACHHLNGPTARFCGRCSAPLKTIAAEEPNRSWRQVLSSLNAKGGERKRLTILFADIRNSTELIDSLGDPEAGMRRLLSTDPAVIGGRASKVWYGPVRYQRDSEPYMRIAVAGNLEAAGVAIADVNLKLIWDVIAAI